MKKLILLLLSLQCSLFNISLAQQPGDLDDSFNGSGQVYKNHSPWLDIAIQPDGRSIAVGDVMTRYKTNGTLDSTFGISGTVIVEVIDTTYNGYSIGIQPDGKILVAGGGDITAGPSDFVLIRFKTDGTIDSTFDGDGLVLTGFDPGSDDRAYELAIQPDGKIVVAGGSDQKLALCRYNSDGSLDNTFDNDGKLLINTINVEMDYYSGHPNYMKLQPDGKILVGSANNLARLGSDGSLDNSFGTNGSVTLPGSMNDLVIQPDNNILLAGRSNSNGFVIVRLHINGDLDNDFGNGGVAISDWFVLGCYNPHQLATSIALQPDGRVLAGGYNVCCQLGVCRDFVLMRYDPDGSLDSSFGDSGKVVTHMGSLESESHASIITADLKLLLVGRSPSSFGDDYGFLARYHLGDLLEVNNVAVSNEHFIISPNPTFDQINIHGSKIENGIWHLELRDITGRLIWQEDIEARIGAIDKSVSLQHLPEGIYLLQLDNGKERTISRVVKCK